MKAKRYTEEQIVRILQEHEAGKPVDDLVREYGISRGSLYRWKARFGGMDVAEARRLKQLEEENARLKKLVADQALDIVMLKDLNSKNGEAQRSPGRRRSTRGGPRGERASSLRLSWAASQHVPLPIHEAV